MSRLHSLRGFALTLGVLGVANSCSVPFSDVIAPNAARGEMFNSYVAIGNNITAGFMSGGIIDSTQRRSYAFLLAQSMGTRFAYPSLAGRGCAPLITNFQTQARPAGTTGATCDLRSAATATDVLNNVGVPGAWSYDPNATTSATSNALTTFFLGGKSQVQRAREAKPSFVTIWIGNNDVLGPAVSSGGCTTVATGCAVTLSSITAQLAFAASYDAMIDSLRKDNPALKGLLVGVVNVTNAPILFRADTLRTATFKTTFDAVACGGVPNSCAATGNVTLLDASCSAGTTVLINTFMAHQIRAGTHPSNISCVPGGAGGTLPAPVGDAFVLTAAEQAIVTAAVTTGYNTYISAKANTLGWAYYDPNTTLAALRTTGTVVRQVPNYASTTNPFGTGMSLDGVHPFGAGHLLIANDMITVINAKFGSKLPAVF